jgi:uridine kinase
MQPIVCEQGLALRITQMAPQPRRLPLPLVGISGIDGSGKSRLAKRLAAQVSQRGIRVALVELENWHNPPSVRFGGAPPGHHFFQHGLRFAELLARLVTPLRKNGEVTLTFDALRADEQVARQKTIAYSDADIILFEGIFLFRREMRPIFDLAVWVDCSFETALRRALSRNQEGLSEQEIVRDYENIYFPAQRFHMQRDNPRESADVIIENER